MRAEVLVHRVEGFFKAAPRFGVQLLDRLLRIANGIEQILPLRVEEVVALLRFLEFLESLGIHRPQGLDARANFLVPLLRFRHAGLVQRNIFFPGQAGGDLRRRGVQLLAAGFVQILEVALFLDQLQLDLGAPLLRHLRFDAQSP